MYPDIDYSLHCTIAYKRWPLEYQYANLHALEDFTEEIAAARTFLYLDEIVELYQKGLIQGGDPAKVVIFSDHTANDAMLKQVVQAAGKVVHNLVTPGQSASPILRYANEPARHKLLDLMGDLVLLGRPLQGKVFAHKPGHGPNIRFVAALKKVIDVARNERSADLQFACSTCIRCKANY